MSDEFKVQWSVSLPPAAQYAKGDMLNLRGESVEEVQGIFDAILDGDSAFIASATQVGALLRAAAVVSDGTTEAPAAPAEPPAKEVPAAGVSYMCEHGKRERRTGTKKDGTKWAGHFCPLPKERKADQCKPVWED